MLKSKKTSSDDWFSRLEISTENFFLNPPSTLFQKVCELEMSMQIKTTRSSKV